MGATNVANSQDPQVSVQIDKDEVVLGDRVQLTVTVEGASRATPPELPEIPNFNVRYLGSRSESFRSVSVIVQGKRVEEKRSGGGIHYEYALTPKKVGMLEIPPFSFMVDGERYHTSKPYVIQVTDAPAAREDISMRVTVDKETVYLGESVLLTFELFFDKNIQDYSLNIPWYGALKDFLVQDPEHDSNKQYARLIVNDKEKISAEKKIVTLRGKRYTVLTFQKILTPISDGVYSLDPAFLRAEVVEGYQTPRKRRFLFKSYFDWMFEDDFFGRRAVTETVVARSEPLLLTVKALPEKNRPSTFTGAVGSFDFQVSAKPSTVQRGEPVTVTLKVIGSGNFNEIQLPKFPELSAFKAYAPEIRTETSLVEGMAIGEKIFERVLVGRREGTYEIPPLVFTFFDPEAGNYQTITRGPFTIQVTPGAAQEAPLPTYTLERKPGQRGKEIRVITQDIRYIKTELGALRHSERPLHEMPFFWWLGFVPLPLITAGSFLIQRRRLKFRRDIGYARRVHAFKKAQKEFTACTRCVKEAKTDEFYACVSKTLTHFLGDKLNRSPAGITGEIVSVLQEKRLDPKLLQELKSCFDHLDFARYSHARGNPEEMWGILQQVQRLVNTLEKII